MSDDDVSDESGERFVPGPDEELTQEQQLEYLKDTSEEAERATEPDEEEILRGLDELPDDVFAEPEGRPESAALQAFLSKMRDGLGASGRPNVASRWYAKRNGNDFLRAPWCDMRVTWAAFHSGNHAAVCFGTDFAYTVYHAQAFEQRGRWKRGTSGIRAGDVIFFDWRGGAALGGIDHVGVVERVLADGRVQTIEGNTGDALRRRVRGGSTITGYGRPKWGDSKPDAVTLQKGDSGPLVRALQRDLLKVGQKLPKFGADGDFGDETVAAVKAFQKKAGFKGDDIDGKVRPRTRKALNQALRNL